MSTVEQTKGPPNIRQVVYNSITWVDVVRPTLVEMEYLKKTYNFHPLALEDALAKVQLPKVDHYGDYLFIVLHFPLYDPGARLTLHSEVDFFVGGNYLITVHNGSLRPLAKLFGDCGESELVRRELMSHSSGFLLYRVVSSLVDYCSPILDQLIESVDNAEKTLFDARARERARVLAEIRREVLAYRRIIRPQIDVLELMENGEYPFLKVDPDVYFGDLADRIRRIWAELEDLKETVEGLHDTHASLIQIRSNEVVRVLTIIFTLTVPATLLANLYGMNVGLPLQHKPHAFGALMGIMGAGTLALLVLLRARRWF